VERDVTLDDFRQVMEEVTPSVSRKEVRKYEKFRFGE
jgi:SpoVK/Ycf46/Vps4 family AAA+-type ATPase